MMMIYEKNTLTFQIMYRYDKHLGSSLLSFDETQKLPPKLCRHSFCLIYAKNFSTFFAYQFQNNHKQIIATYQIHVILIRLVRLALEHFLNINIPILHCLFLKTTHLSSGFVIVVYICEDLERI